MTKEEREKAINALKISGPFMAVTQEEFDDYIKTLNNLMDWLEQESVLDKIIAEIIDTGAYEQEVNGKTEFLKCINYCLSVIDKYKTESEK